MCSFSKAFFKEVCLSTSAKGMWQKFDYIARAAWIFNAVYFTQLWITNLLTIKFLRFKCVLCILWTYKMHFCMYISGKHNSPPVWFYLQKELLLYHRPCFHPHHKFWVASNKCLREILRIVVLLQKVEIFFLIEKHRIKSGGASNKSQSEILSERHHKNCHWLMETLTSKPFKIKSNKI